MGLTNGDGEDPDSITGFGELLAATVSSAIHLETRDVYTPESPRFRAWLGGHRPDPADRPSWWRPFHSQVAEAVARGVRVRRARIVSEPVSRYVRFEHDVTFQNLSAGEEVRWLPRRLASDLLVPCNDFWVFDDRLVRFHHFSGDGRSVGKELRDDPVVVAACVAAFDSVWSRALAHPHYRPV